MTENNLDKYYLVLIRQSEGRGRFVIEGQHCGYEPQHRSDLDGKIRIEMIDAGLEYARNNFIKTKELPGRIKVSRYEKDGIDNIILS